jgi:hypothetical protein
MDVRPQLINRVQNLRKQSGLTSPTVFGCVTTGPLG